QGATVPPTLAERTDTTDVPMLAQRTDTTVPPMLAERETQARDTRDKLAEMAGVSHGTLDKIRVIEELATDVQRSALSDGSATIDKTYKEIKGQSKPTAETTSTVQTWDKDEESIREQIRHIGLELTGSANSKFITVDQLAGQIDEMLGKLSDAAEALRGLK